MVAKKRIWDAIKGAWKEVTAEHPSHAGKRAIKDAKKAKDKAAREAYKKKKKGPVNVLPRGPVPKTEPKGTPVESSRLTPDKPNLYKKPTDPLALRKANEKTAAAKKAATAKANKKGEKLKADRKKARDKKSSSVFTSPKTRKKEAALKKGMETRTASKKVRLNKSRYRLKNPDSTKEVIYDWDAKKNKFVVKKGKPPKKDSTYEGERPPRTESGKLAKTDPAKKRFSKEQQLEKTRRTLPKKDPEGDPITPKGKGLKRPPEPKKLPPSKKKKKKEKKDKPYNAGKKAGR